MRATILLLACACAVLAGCRTRERAAGAPPRGPYLYVFAGDADHAAGHAAGAHAGHAASEGGASPAGHSDFLAVIDADTASPSYGRVVATAPLGAVGGMPHHIEPEMPAGGRALFASAYAAGRAYRFDLAEPERPRLAGTLDSVPGLRTPHSFVRLPDGDVLATMQFGDGRTPGDPGGLARFSPEGRVVRATRSADPAFPGARIRTYAVDVAPAVDRVLTTSSPMGDERTADVVQLWRLSDLSLLRTLAVPQPPGDTTGRYPFEVRFLGDGKTALLNTYYCAFYLLSGLDGDAPAIERVLALDFPRSSGCSVPVVVGHWWIMPVTEAREYVVLDVSDPRRPRRAGALAADSSFAPHWIARDPASDRLVMTSEAPSPGVRLARFDSTTGRLTWDERFRETPGGPPGVSFDRAEWPHGGPGRAIPHGAVFSRAPAPR